MLRGLDIFNCKLTLSKIRPKSNADNPRYPSLSALSIFKKAPKVGALFLLRFFNLKRFFIKIIRAIFFKDAGDDCALGNWGVAGARGIGAEETVSGGTDYHIFNALDDAHIHDFAVFVAHKLAATFDIFSGRKVVNVSHNREHRVFVGEKRSGSGVELTAFGLRSAFAVLDKKGEDIAAPEHVKINWLAEIWNAKIVADAKLKRIDIGELERAFFVISGQSGETFMGDRSENFADGKHLCVRRHHLFVNRATDGACQGVFNHIADDDEEGVVFFQE